MSEQTEQVRKLVADFNQNLSLPVVNIFPTLSAVLRQISELIQTVDLSHLSSVPVRDVAKFTNHISEAAECIAGFMVPSYPVEERVRNQTMRPEVHIRNQININSWRGKLERIHSELFQLLGPIVAFQQLRVMAVASGVPITVDASRSIAAARHSQNLWRYMPVRNLLRAEAQCGIWMVSLERLRTWSAPNMADIREGEVPPVVDQLKSEYESAISGSAKVLDGFKAKYSLNDLDVEKLAQSLDFRFERQNTFVSSWSQKRTESMPMWSAYGDAGKGIALRSNIGKLLDAEWRVPLSLSGLNGPNRFSGLMVREIKYLDFDQNDAIPPIDDLHLPLLKRSLFEDEREARLLGFATNPIASQGFPLYCNLQKVITEIIVGPHGDFDATVAELTEKAPDLVGIPIIRSALSPDTR